MLVASATKNDIQAIVEAITKKSKLRFRYSGKSLLKQAKHFTPAYRDFILKVIKNNSLKIKPTYSRGGSMTGSVSDKTKRPLSKRQNTYILSNISDVDTLPHEIGHAVDFWFGTDTPLSSIVLVDGDKTLNDIFVEEFNSKYKEIYEEVMGEFKNIINSTINDKAYDILREGFPDYQKLLLLDEREKKQKRGRKVFQKKLLESGFVEVYYQFVTKKCYSMLNKKYAPILDALSSKYDLSGFFLEYHDIWYYLLDKERITQEFFANMFAAKVTSKHAYFDNLIKYLPRSFNAFERLFVIFYDHIQNNKRFNDVKIKEVC